MGKGKVPFSWEDMPGISKSKGEADWKLYSPSDKLPPPPCPQSHTRKTPFHEIQNIPLPPCAFQPPPRLPPPQRSLSNKASMKKDVDPFFVAYQECTKSTKEVKMSTKQGGIGSGLRKHVSGILCNRSCSVRDGNLIRISHSDS